MWGQNGTLLGDPCRSAVISNGFPATLLGTIQGNLAGGSNHHTNLIILSLHHYLYLFMYRPPLNQAELWVLNSTGSHASSPCPPHLSTIPSTGLSISRIPTVPLQSRSPHSRVPLRPRSRTCLLQTHHPAILNSCKHGPNRQGFVTSLESLVAGYEALRPPRKQEL